MKRPFVYYKGRFIMEIGILGLPQSGKSTLFEIMTGIHSRDMHGDPCIRGLTNVPDDRFDELVNVFQPVKNISRENTLYRYQHAGRKYLGTDPPDPEWC